MGHELPSVGCLGASLGPDWISDRPRAQIRLLLMLLSGFAIDCAFPSFRCLRSSFHPIHQRLSLLPMVWFGSPCSLRLAMS